MSQERPEGGTEGYESTLPFVLQLILLVLLSLHAVAVGVWGVAFLRDLSRDDRNKGPLTSAELSRQRRERRVEERVRSGVVAKME